MKPILIIQNCPIESAGTILDYFNQNGISYQVFHSYTNSDFPQLDNFEAVINLGCPTSVIEYQNHQFLKNLYSFVALTVKENKPYLGLCFGAQILAKVLGASVDANHVKEIGIYNVSLTKEGTNDTIFQNIDKNFKVFHWHGDTFKIPFGASHLASSDNCINQAFRKNNAIGLQFHFEANINEIPEWCDAYSDELSEVQKTKDNILAEYQSHFEIVKKNNFQLLENFISIF